MPRQGLDRERVRAPPRRPPCPGRPRPPKVGPRHWVPGRQWLRAAEPPGQDVGGQGSSEQMENSGYVQRPEQASRLPGSPLSALTVVYTEASPLQEQLWKLGYPWDEEKEVFLNWFISKLCKYLTVLNFNTAIFFPERRLIHACLPCILTTRINF